MKRLRFALRSRALLCALLLLMPALLCACAPKPAADLTALYDAFALSDMTPLALSDLSDWYGIEPGDVKQAVAALHATGLQCDEIVLVEATDNAAADRVELALQARYDQKLAEYRDYLPDEYAVLTQCAVHRHAAYVALVLCHDPEPRVALWEKAVR